MRVAAKFISFVFHPLLMATYLVIVLGKFFPVILNIRPDRVWILTTFVFALTFIVPGLNILLLRYFGSVKSLDMEVRSDRVTPFTFIAIMYTLVAILFYYRLPASGFDNMMIIVAVLVIVATLITYFYKISIHSMAMGGLLGILFPLLRFSPQLIEPTAIIVLITGLGAP